MVKAKNEEIEKTEELISGSDQFPIDQAIMNKLKKQVRRHALREVSAVN